MAHKDSNGKGAVATESIWWDGATLIRPTSNEPQASCQAGCSAIRQGNVVNAFTERKFILQLLL
ncbi:hypothetical protein KCP73_12360 [Salmonella enterica subsp. enterica]|nr:hypothetical protein KCP73_12360 [Salmonella enterica subsp. enterica]